jgi:type I restriction enzyme S subunit
MDNGFKPYPEYKKTGLLWLDSVPEHWELKKIKHLFTERVEKGYPEEPLLAATQTKGVVPKNLYESRTVTAEKDLHLLKLVKVGDFVISLRSFQGGIEYAYYQGIISPAYTVIVPNSEINRGYFRHLAKSRLFLELLKLCVTGIREGQNIDYSMLRDSDIPLPPKEEQDQIVRYLDSKLAKINKYIKNKKKLIELLKEQKQAIINQAVTKGLDPNAKMKPSGIEWLGEIPEGWEVRRLKTVVRNIANTTTKKENDEIYIGLENVASWSGRIINVSIEGVFDSQAKKFNENNILFGKLRPYLAKVTMPCQSGVCSGEFLVLEKLNDNVLDKYVEHFLRSKRVIDLISRSTHGAKMPRAEWKFIGNIKMGFPPLREQQKITAYINRKIHAIDKTIERINTEIDLITEYRTSLISNVVTGKVDVRNIEVEDSLEEIEEDVESLGEETLEEEEISVGEEG